MADTQRTLAELLTIFADGQGTGAITPQDMRDFVVSLYNATDDTVDIDERGSAPSPISGVTRLYVSSNGSLHIVTDDGMDRSIAGPDSPPIYRSYSHITGFAGTHWMAGFYEVNATAVALSLGGSTVHGTANSTHGAHAFVVASGVGTSDKTTGAVRLNITGTSVDTAGNRTTSDSEIIIANIEDVSVITDAYFETSKTWVGAITFILENDATGDATTASFSFNCGLAKYEDFGNRNFTVVDFEAVGGASSNDTGFDLEFLYHTNTGWTYAPTGFIPGNGAIVQLSVDRSTDRQLVSGEHFAYKRTVDQAVQGSSQEGVIVRMTTTAVNSVEHLDVHIGVRF